MDFLQLLPPDIIFNHIINHLDDASKVRAATVCHGWREVVREAPSIPPMPHLLFEWVTDELQSGFRFDLMSLYCLRDLASFTTTNFDIYHINGLASHVIVIGSGGPFVTLLSKYKSMANTLYKHTIYSAFSGKTFPLPSLKYDADDEKEYPACFFRIQFSSYPPDCLIAAWDDDYPHGNIWFCRIGDQCWAQGPRTRKGLRDMIFHKETLYGVLEDFIVAYDVNVHNYLSSSSLTPRRIAPADHLIYGSSLRRLQKKYDVYLVNSEEELLVVTQTVTPQLSKCGESVTFMVYRVDEEKGELVRVMDLGERMLFVQHCGCSLSRSGRGTVPDGFFTNNCIYYFDVLEWRDYWPVYGLCKFELGTGSIHFHPRYIFTKLPSLAIPPSPKY